jgi:CelD/BcsL family acetyltransferase involved in cellulose biosynthesis
MDRLRPILGARALGARLNATVHDDIDPLAALPALAGAPFQSSPAWWRCIQGAAVPPGARPLYLVAAGCVVPLLRHAAGGRHEAGGLTSLQSPYTLLWQPVGPADAPWRQVGRDVARAARGTPVLRLDALDADWPGLAAFLAGLRAGGRVVQRFAHFGNWHDSLPPGGWPAYLACRPGALRETIRRKSARLGRDPALRITLARGVAEVPAALAAYREVYGLSWKQPEPYPAFDACLLQAAALRGLLRLGVLWHGPAPIAAQYWLVERGTATMLKLAHDERHKPLSPGTVLTAWMIRSMIEQDAIQALDFGRGDDLYKRDWVARRRQRIGVLAADPLHWRGVATIARHAVGTLRRRRSLAQLSSSESQ